MEVQNIKNQVVTGFNKYYKPVLYVIAGLVILYGAIYLFTPKPQMPAEYRVVIDSIRKENVALAGQQKHLDSAIQAYQFKINELDSQVSHIKEKTTIIKEYHHEIIQTVSNYSAGQIDSFLKKRYNY